MFSHINKFLSGHPRDINSPYFQNPICCIGSESLLVRRLALVMVDKEKGIILRSILQSGIYGQLLWYVVILLDVNWDTVTSAGGVVTQDIGLAFVSTESN